MNRQWQQLQHFWRRLTQGSIRRQLTWAFGLLALLVPAIAGMLVYLHQRDFLYGQGERNARGLADALAVSSSSWLVARDMAGLQEVAAGFATTSDLKFAAVISRRGEVLASTVTDQVGRYFSDTISQNLMTAPAQARTLVSGPDLIDVAAPVMSGARHVGWVRVEMTQDAANRHLNEIAQTGLLLVGGGLLVTAWLSVVLARRLARRLEQLVRVAESVGQGHEYLRSSVGGADEIGQLAQRFNAMLDTLAVQQGDLRVAATAFETQEPMVILDASQRFMRVNQAFERSFGHAAADVQGKDVTLIRSDRHTPEFYEDAWRTIEHTRIWQGEIWYRRRNGEEFPSWVSVTAVRDEAGRASHYVMSMMDITQRKRAEEEIRQLAYFDPLTELPNRRMLQEQLRQALAAVQRSNRHGALLFLDLDNFKTINDTLGHDKGDVLLREVARRLRRAVRDSDVVARLGGDEFVVMLSELDHDTLLAAREAEQVAEKLLAALREPYDLGGIGHHNSASVGVTLFGAGSSSADELMKQADLALHQAKAGGRDSSRFFDPAMQARVSERMLLERDLRQGLQAGQFLLYFQPQVDGSGGMTGAEVLVRWQHPQRGLVSPAAFIPLAEDSGLILPLGRWVLEQACRQLARWAADPGSAGLTLAVNVSSRELRQADFVQAVLAVLAQTGANPARLKLELTESLLLDNVSDTIRKMEELKAHGVGFSLDDFGTGYSSLSYLKRLPLDQLKIDQSFVHDAIDNPHDTAIVRAIVALGHSLKLQVIAEGVETPAQREFLAAQGCHHCQGYLFGRPGPVEALGLFLPPGGLSPVSTAADH